MLSSNTGPSVRRYLKVVTANEVMEELILETSTNDRLHETNHRAQPITILLLVYKVFTQGDD